MLQSFLQAGLRADDRCFLSGYLVVVCMEDHDSYSCSFDAQHYMTFLVAILTAGSFDKGHGQFLSSYLCCGSARHHANELQLALA